MCEIYFCEPGGEVWTIAGYRLVGAGRGSASSPAHPFRLRLLPPLHNIRLLLNLITLHTLSTLQLLANSLLFEYFFLFSNNKCIQNNTLHLLQANKCRASSPKPMQAWYGHMSVNFHLVEDPWNIFRILHPLHSALFQTLPSRSSTPHSRDNGHPKMWYT